MYYILEVRHKSFGDKLKSDYPTIKGYLNDCNIIKYLHKEDDLNLAIHKYLEYIEPDWKEMFLYEKESILNCLEDSYHCGIIHRLTIYGIPKEYVLIDDSRNTDLMNGNFYSLIRDNKLELILNSN